MIRCVLALVLAVTLLPGVALAERRALIVGNDLYREIPTLAKAGNDARATGSTLSDLGFAVTAAIDVDRRAMNREISRFLGALRPGDEAMFFFAGHGIEIDGENYLLPVDIPRSDSKEFIKSESIALSGLLDRIRQTGAGVTLAVIDACRDNPFANADGKRSFGGRRGLGRITAPEGTFVIFSAGAGQSALDALGPDDADPNSVFTRSFLPLIGTPGLELRDVALTVRRAVRGTAQNVNHLPTPAYYDELLGDFRFALAAPQPTAPAPSLPAPQAAEPQAVPGTIRQDFELAQAVGTAAAWEAFLRRYDAYPGNFLVQLAEAALEALDDEPGAPDPVPETPPEDEPLAVAVPRPPVERSPVVTTCDRLAASPSDTLAVAGPVDWEDIDADRALPACRAAVEADPDNPRLLYQLGRVLGSMERSAEAARWYEEAAEFDHPVAMNNLGVAYERGRGVAQDYGRALELYEGAAELGVAAAMNNLGVMNRQGRGKEVDLGAALYWYRRAADEGWVDAMVNLGWMYDEGVGVAEDNAAAIRWYRMAADEDSARALNNLGHNYEEGDGVPQDDAEAVRYYREAASLGYARAMTNLGLMYERGRGVAEDDDAAMHWYKQAAEQDCARAITNIGWLHASGQGVPKDDAEAYRWYLRAANLGYARAMTNVAYGLESGKGVAEDDRAAIDWYRKAADLDDPRALNNLGAMYDNGDGVRHDPDEAARLLAAALVMGYEFTLKKLTESPRTYKLGTRKALQRILHTAGYYDGAIDGVFGKGTRAAIAAYAAAGE